MKRAAHALAVLFLTLQTAMADTNPPTLAPAPTNLVAATNTTPKLAAPKPDHGKALVYVIPIEGPILEPMVYIVRRGVKEAIAANASLLILDMDTPGGSVAAVVEIMDLLDQFKGETMTFVRKDAYSGGAFVSAATKHIFMAPGSVIGAAAVIAGTPTGGAESLQGTLELKMTSAVAAKIRAAAQRNGHDAAVFDAMVNKNKGLKIGEQVICKEGDILTLTNVEAEKE